MEPSTTPDIPLLMKSKGGNDRRNDAPEESSSVVIPGETVSCREHLVDRDTKDGDAPISSPSCTGSLQSLSTEWIQRLLQRIQKWYRWAIMALYCIESKAITDDNEARMLLRDRRRRHRRRILAMGFSTVAAATVVTWISRQHHGFGLTRLGTRLGLGTIRQWFFRWLVLQPVVTHQQQRQTQVRPDYRSATEVPLSFLYSLARQGMLQRAVISANTVFFLSNPPIDESHRNTTMPWKKAQLPPNNTTLQRDLIHQLSSQCSDVSAMPEAIWSRVETPLLAALPFVYLLFLYRIVKGSRDGSSNDPFDFGRHLFSKKTTTTAISTTSNNHVGATTFADVAGMDDVLIEMREVVQYLQNPSRFWAFGAHVPRGILLYGPAGVGKTLLARAVAGEADVDAFIACSASEFVEVYVGRGAARVRLLFDRARKEAIQHYQQKQQQQQRRRRQRYQQPIMSVDNQSHQKYTWWRSYLSSQREEVTTITGCDVHNHRRPTAVIFLDELDALAKTRASSFMLDGNNSNEERDQTLNQLLTEMDGFWQHPEVTVVVMAATNRASLLDPAIVRRMDRQIHVPYPTPQSRKAILQVHAQRIRLLNSSTPIQRKNPIHKNNEIELDQENLSDNNTIIHGSIDWTYLASDCITGGFSGSDLCNLINEAALLAVREQSCGGNYGSARTSSTLDDPANDDHDDNDDEDAVVGVCQYHLEQAAQRIRAMKGQLQQPLLTYTSSGTGLSFSTPSSKSSRPSRRSKLVTG